MKANFKVSSKQKSIIEQSNVFCVILQQNGAKGIIEMHYTYIAVHITVYWLTGVLN